MILPKMSIQVAPFWQRREEHVGNTGEGEGEGEGEGTIVETGKMSKERDDEGSRNMADVSGTNGKDDVSLWNEEVEKEERKKRDV